MNSARELTAEPLNVLPQKESQTPVNPQVKNQPKAFPLGRVVESLLLALVFIFATAELFSIFTLSPFPQARRVAIAALLISAWRPFVGISLLLFLLPVFGNRPGTLQSEYFLLLQSACLFSGLLRVFFRSVFSPSPRAEDFSKQTVWNILQWFVLASLGSLYALPWSQLLQEASGRMQGSRIALAAAFYSFTRITEDDLAFPLLATSLTLVAFGLAYLIRRETSERPFHARIFAACILAGLLLSLVAGLLDYYSFIDLRHFRALDPIVNPGNAQFRLQSFFGHSGWYAEYVTLSIPFALLLLSLRLPFWIRVSVCLLLLMVGEYVLILTYQRGGWISYPITLFSIWAAIYVLRRLEAGETNIRSAVKRSFLKVCLSLPLTVLASLFLISFGMRSGLFSGEVQTTLDSYASRFSDIQKTSDRTDFMIAGYRIAALHPFLGAGSESFGYQFYKEFERPQGLYYRQLILPLHGSAHNLYFQIFSGRGIGGLTFLLLAFATTFFSAIRLVLSENANQEDRVFFLAIACFVGSVLVYGMVQEVFYVQPLQVLVMSVLALGVGRMKAFELDQRQLKMGWFFLILLCIAHVLWEDFVYARMTRDAELLATDTGCYGFEKDERGRAYRWCSPHARISLPVQFLGEEGQVNFSLKADFLNPGMSQAKILVFAETGERMQFSLSPGVEQQVALKLRSRSWSPGDGGSSPPRVFVEMKSNSYFIPQAVFGTGGDYRTMSFRLIYGSPSQE